MQFGNLVSQNQYAGHLTLAQITEGINIAKQNSRRLLEDAKLLLENKRYASATALAILSIEENGKELVLRDLVLCSPTDKTGPYWKRFRSHTEKNKAWIIPLIASTHKTLERLHRAIFDSNSNHPQDLDWLKQAAVYTDCVGRGDWQSPEKLVDELHATRIVEIADQMQGLKPEITEEELKELRELVASGVSVPKIKAFTDKWGHKDLMPVS